MPGVALYKSEAEGTVRDVQQSQFVDAVHALAAPHGAVTHLKLQKLVFYAYGAVVARALAEHVEPLAFEAWKHGPVHKATWLRYRGSGKDALAVPVRPRVQESVLAAIDDATVVYGRLDAWELREESHRERPWKAAFDAGLAAIDPLALERHFKSKFERDYKAPSALGAGSAALDGIPSPTYPSLAAFASILRSRRG